MMNDHQRRRLLEQWRGVPEVELPKNTHKVIGDVLPDVMKSLGLSDRYGEEEIGRAWTSIVGFPLCQQAMPTKLHRKVLHIRMIQPTIHYVLEGMREEILSKFQEQFGTRISEVKFVLR